MHVPITVPDVVVAVTRNDVGVPPEVPAATGTLLVLVIPDGLAGGPGGASRVAGEDAAEVPDVFVAVAVNVYVVSLLRPVTSQDPDAPLTVHVLALPLTHGEAVTRNDAGVPPDVPAATVTVTLPSPATTVGGAGTPGADTAVTAGEPATAKVNATAALVRVP